MSKLVEGRLMIKCPKRQVNGETSSPEGMVVLLYQRAGGVDREYQHLGVK